MFFFCPRILPPHFYFSLWCSLESLAPGLIYPRKFGLCARYFGGLSTRQILPLCGSDHRYTTSHAALESPSRAAQGNPAAGNLRRGGARLVPDSSVGQEAQGESACRRGPRSGIKAPNRTVILKPILNYRLIAAPRLLEQLSTSPVTKPRTRRVNMTSRRTRTWWTW